MNGDLPLKFIPIVGMEFDWVSFTTITFLHCVQPPASRDCGKVLISIATTIIPGICRVWSWVSTTCLGATTILTQVSLVVALPPVHLKSVSTIQLLEHPSPEIVLLSSQPTLPKRLPSPQISIQLLRAFSRNPSLHVAHYVLPEQSLQLWRQG